MLINKILKKQLPFFTRRMEEDKAIPYKQYGGKSKPVCQNEMCSDVCKTHVKDNSFGVITENGEASQVYLKLQRI